MPVSAGGCCPVDPPVTVLGPPSISPLPPYIFLISRALIGSPLNPPRLRSASNVPEATPWGKAASKAPAASNPPPTVVAKPAAPPRPRTDVRDPPIPIPGTGFKRSKPRPAFPPPTLIMRFKKF